jgi:hypothetical protein
MSKRKFMRHSRASGSDKSKIDRFVAQFRSRGYMNLDLRRRAILRLKEGRADG